MRRRAFITSLGSMALAWPLGARAQPSSGKVARIGYLGISNAAASAQVIEATIKGFSELGYVLGKHYVMEYRWAEGRYDRVPALAAELVDLKLDAIFAPSNNAALAARNATTTIPIVIVSVGDPVGLGLVDSLARPGGNVTGLCLMAAPGMAGKRLELFKQTIASLSTVAVLWNPNYTENAPQLEVAKIAAERLRIRLLILEARTPEEFDGVFPAMVDARVDGVFVFGDTVFWMHRKALADHALKNRLPTIGPYREHAEAGGLISYGPSIPDNHRRSAAFVDKILRGAKPGHLPIEQPTKFELLVNLRTAKTLGLTVPESILARADETIY